MKTYKTDEIFFKYLRVIKNKLQGSNDGKEWTSVDGFMKMLEPKL